MWTLKTVPSSCRGAACCALAVLVLASITPGDARAQDANQSQCVSYTNTYNETFTTLTYDAPTTSAAGWGTGEVQLAFKGNTFNAVGQSIGDQAFVVADGDFDGDGWIDMAAIMLSPMRLHFLKNMGVNDNGTHKGFSMGGNANSAGWTAQVIDNNIPDLDANAPSVIAGDFDGDGDPDVLYMKTGTQDTAGSVIRAFVYRLDGLNAAGLPQFTRIELTSFFQTYRVSWHWTANIQQVLDWDKDGRDDLVTGSSYGNTNQVLLFKGLKTGIGFQPPVVLIPDAGLTPQFADTGKTATGGSTCVPPAKSGFYSRGFGGLAIDDYDHDGDYDVALGSLSEKNLKYFVNDGADVMTRAADISFTAGAPTFMLAGDLDGDGNSDITVGRDGWNCNGTGGTVWFFAGDGKGNFTPRSTPILSAGDDLDFGVIFYIDENIKYPQLNKHVGYTLDFIAADGNDSGTYNAVLSQHSTIYNLSNIAESTVVDTLDPAQNAIVAVTMTALSETLPAGTGINFSVTNDGGANWEKMAPAEVFNGARPQTHTFSHFGTQFRFRAELTSTAAVLTGTGAALAPGSKVTPLLDGIAFEYQYVQKNEFSRSSLAYASKLALPDGSTPDVIFSSTFFYPGYEGTLRAFDQTKTSTTTEANNDLNQVITRTGTGSAVIWDAGALLKSRSGGSRTIYTALPNGAGVVNQRQDFSSGNASTLSNIMATDQTTAGKVIDFVRNGFGYADGTKLFDVGHSSPVFVQGVPLDPSANDPSLSADNYSAFVTQMTTSKRDSMVYIGANSGMVHAFSAITGEERWAFVPYNLLAKMKTQMLTDASGAVSYQHQYMVDGSIVVRDVYDRATGQWKTILIGGQALGTGRSDENYYFALDVTDPGNPRPLWEFTDPWLAGTTSCTGALSQTVCVSIPTQSCTNFACNVTNHQAGPNANGVIIQEAENYNTTASLDNSHVWTLYQTPAGFTGTGFMEVPLPKGNDKACTNFTNCGATMNYSLRSDTATYQLYIRYQTAAAASLRFTIGSVTETASLAKGNAWAWYKSTSTIPLAANDQVLTFFMVNSGVMIDRFMLVPAGTSLPPDNEIPTCTNVCITTGTTQQCSTQTYAADAESFECGVGSGLKCCHANSQYFCSPVGESCDAVDTVTGETWSTPVVAPVLYGGNRSWFVFFGSGYNNRPAIPAAVGRSVYGIDAASGVLRARWDYDDLPFQAGVNVSTIDNTIPGGVAVFDYTTTGTDATPDGFADVAYVGDLEGRMWKIDLHSNGALGSGGLVSLNAWPTCMLFDAADQTNGGVRQWAPIITTPAVTTIKQDTSTTPYLPYVYFGTGGDDRAPSSILYRFYAVKDTVTCPPSATPTSVTAKHEIDLTSDTSHLEWIVGDGKDVLGNPLNPPEAEGTIGQRYWSDPMIYQNSVIYFASLDGSIESVNPCDNLAGASLLYGYAIHDFFSGASPPAKAGSSIVQLSGFAGTAPYYRSASKIRRSALVSMQVPTAGVAQPPPANAVAGQSGGNQIFIQTFDGNVRTISAPTFNSVNTIRLLRWREIPLR